MINMDQPPENDAPGADPTSALRRQAESLASEPAGAPSGSHPALSPEATRQMVHELRVHQIELEMQNEELRRTQVELEAARSRYFDLYDLAPVGYCSVDESGLVVQANLAIATLLGVARGALAKQPISGFIATADQDIYYLCRKRLISTGAAQACELRMTKSDGNLVWIQMAATIVYDADGAYAIRMVLTDVSERELMASALQEREERYRTMVEWSPEAIIVHRHGSLIYANTAALQLFGTQAVQDLVGKPLLERVHPDFHAVVQARAQAMAETKGTAPRVGLVLFKLDGTPIDVEIQSIWTVYDREPAIQVAMHDVTERNRLGAALQQKNVELQNAKTAAERANLAKSDFLSSMSHELRTPLHAVLGFAQLLESGTPALTPSQKRNIDQILQAGWYLLELINEILDLALIESGKLSLSLEPLALAEVMRECQAMVQPQAQGRDIGLRFACSDATCLVNADRTRVKQVLLNLLSNAIKYNQAGGTVAVDCLAVEPGRLRVSVTDTGPGLGADRLARLFQPFNRLGQEAHAGEGTGIGLVMCKRLVELMGGAIGVRSKVGEGSLFWIELKRADTPPPANQAGDLALKFSETESARTAKKEAT